MLLWSSPQRTACLPVPQMRDAVESVARLFPTAIISGRGREKVESFVQLRELYYAGSHGMDIIGPRVCIKGECCSARSKQLACTNQLMSDPFG